MLTADNFNEPAPEKEIRAALVKMRQQRHVNRGIVQEYLERPEAYPYTMTRGKLAGLTSTSLGVDTKAIAKSLGVTVEHPRRDGK